MRDNPFPNKRWGPHDGTFITPAQLRKNRKRGWYTIMAERHGIVPSNKSKAGRCALIAHLLPDLFFDEAQARAHTSRTFIDELTTEWGRGDMTEARIRLAGRRFWTDIIVHTGSKKRAVDILRNALPDDTEIALPV